MAPKHCARVQRHRQSFNLNILATYSLGQVPEMFTHLNKILCAFQSVDLLLLHQWLVCTLLHRAILKLLMQYNCCLIYVICAKCLMMCGKKIELDYINAINRFCHLCLLVKTYICYMFYLIRHSNFIQHQNVER